MTEEKKVNWIVQRKDKVYLTKWLGVFSEKKKDALIIADNQEGKLVKDMISTFCLKDCKAVKL